MTADSTDNDTDNNTDNASVGSNASSKSAERRRRRESWRREHESQLEVDGAFPRRNSGKESDSSRKAVSAKVVQHIGTISTAKPHTLPPTVSADVRMRSNLLRTLGIQQGGNNMVGGPPMLNNGKSMGGGRGHRRIKSAGGETLKPGSELLRRNTATSRSLLSNVRLKDELKYDSDEEATPFTNSYSRFFGGRYHANSLETKPPKNTTNIPRRRRLLFSEAVEVVPIPMRSEYSNRIKDRMYSGRVELSENAQRNVVEFEAEGWDATTVLDDENQFYKCPLTGELIHPVHLAYFNKGGGEIKDDQR
mmetsp:Transcript_25885/g.42049  ORF Transcript_25885/g.42049 Transcript_25885/m.42049 type:complete len:306 (-) Transcript_25885:297-1214(-)